MEKKNQSLNIVTLLCKLHMTLFLSARGEKFTLRAHILFTANLKLQAANGCPSLLHRATLVFDPSS